jgi:hypothetical protein
METRLGENEDRHQKDLHMIVALEILPLQMFSVPNPVGIGMLFSCHHMYQCTNKRSRISPDSPESLPTSYVTIPRLSRTRDKI